MAEPLYWTVTRSVEEDRVQKCRLHVCDDHVQLTSDDIREKPLMKLHFKSIYQWGASGVLFAIETHPAHHLLTFNTTKGEAIAKQMMEKTEAYVASCDAPAAASGGSGAAAPPVPDLSLPGQGSGTGVGPLSSRSAWDVAEDSTSGPRPESVSPVTDLRAERAGAATATADDGRGGSPLRRPAPITAVVVESPFADTPPAVGSSSASRRTSKVTPLAAAAAAAVAGSPAGAGTGSDTEFQPPRRPALRHPSMAWTSSPASSLKSFDFEEVTTTEPITPSTADMPPTP